MIEEKGQCPHSMNGPGQDSITNASTIHVDTGIALQSQPNDRLLALAELVWRARQREATEKETL